MKNIIIILSLDLILSGCLPAQNAAKNQLQNTNQVVFCTQDARECPDGTYVSRVAPNCDFAPCPASIIKNDTIKPIAEFDSRITKKPFGIYITPQTSPVQPEKFTGYHTGIDVEYSDMPDIDVPIFAIADGQVVRSGWVSGYGGMVAIRHTINNKDYIVIYGHLVPDSLPDLNTQVKKGDIIGFLGKGYSHDTDGERKHLHFAIYNGTDINVKGYVQNKNELNKWLDPLVFFK